MDASNPYALAEERYRDLEARYQRGQLSAEAFQQARMECLVRDEAGRHWLPAPDPGHWLLWDGQQWALYDPADPARDAPVPPGRRARRRPPAPREPAKRGLGCGGCLLAALAVVLLLVAFGVWRSPLPERWGLRQSAAERLLGEANRQVADELVFELAAQGATTEGVYFYVLPVEGGEDHILYVVADASEGFQGIKAMAGSPDALVAYLVSLAQSETVSKAGIARLALDYRDESGAEFGVLTARTDDLLAFARGEMTREAFMEVLDGRLNLALVVEGARP